MGCSSAVWTRLGLVSLRHSDTAPILHGSHTLHTGLSNDILLEHTSSRALHRDSLLPSQVRSPLGRTSDCTADSAGRARGRRPQRDRTIRASRARRRGARKASALRCPPSRLHRCRRAGRGAHTLRDILQQQGHRKTGHTSAEKKKRVARTVRVEILKTKISFMDPSNID